MPKQLAINCKLYSSPTSCQPLYAAPFLWWNWTLIFYHLLVFELDWITVSARAHPDTQAAFLAAMSWHSWGSYNQFDSKPFFPPYYDFSCPGAAHHELPLNSLQSYKPFRKPFIFFHTKRLIHAILMQSMSQLMVWKHTQKSLGWWDLSVCILSGFVRSKLVQLKLECYQKEATTRLRLRLVHMGVSLSIWRLGSWLDLCESCSCDIFHIFSHIFTFSPVHSYLAIVHSECLQA